MQQISTGDWGGASALDRLHRAAHAGERTNIAPALAEGDEIDPRAWQGED